MSPLFVFAIVIFTLVSFVFHVVLSCFSLVVFLTCLFLEHFGSRYIRFVLWLMFFFVLRFFCTNVFIFHNIVSRIVHSGN